MLHFLTWRPSSSSSTDLQLTATLCSTQQHTTALFITLQHTEAPCSTLQHILQHIYYLWITTPLAFGNFPPHEKKEKNKIKFSAHKSHELTLLSSLCIYIISHICDMTRSPAWHDSCTCATWPIHIRYMTHSHVWHDSFACALQHTAKKIQLVRVMTPTRWLYIWGGCG